LRDLRCNGGEYEDRDSSVSIATRYGLGGPGIEACWGEIFRTRPYLPLAHRASCTMGIGSLSGGGVKRSVRGVDHPQPSSAEVKGRSGDIIIFIYWNWVVTRWLWLFYIYTKYEIGY